MKIKQRSVSYIEADRGSPAASSSHCKKAYEGAVIRQERMGVVSARVYSTEEVAGLARVLPNTIRSNLCRFGHWLGLRPVKLSNRRLLWNAEQVERVLMGEVPETVSYASSVNALVEQSEGAGDE